MPASTYIPTGYESYSDDALRARIRDVLATCKTDDIGVLDDDFFREIERRDPESADLHKARNAVIEADNAARAEAKGAPLLFGDMTLDSFLPDTDAKLDEARAKHRARLGAWIDGAI